MDVSSWRELLKNSTLFSRLANAEIERLLKESESLTFRGGDIIIREGELGEHVYLIGTGMVSITLPGAREHNLPFEHLSAGNFFGEMACIEHKPRMATVVADKDCEVLQIRAELFHDLVEKNPRFASRFSLTLSERLRKLTEEILAVRVKDVDEKLELSNTKLDASLKAMESQMKAAETIFEQTSIRASEVIHSFDRTRTQVILVVSIVTVIASLILGLLTFFGWKEWKQISGPIQEKAQLVDQKLSEININTALSKKLNEQTQNELAEVLEQKKVLKDLKSTVEDARNAQLTLYSVIIKSNFDSVVLDRRDDIYREMLKVADSNLTENLFLQFPRGLMNPIPGIQQSYVHLLKVGLDRNYIRTPKQRALTYYYLMAAQLLNNDEQDYIATRIEFDRYMQRQDSEPITIIQDLGPSWFEEYLQAASSSEEISLKVSRLKEVWDKITQK